MEEKNEKQAVSNISFGQLVRLMVSIVFFVFAGYLMANDSIGPCIAFIVAGIVLIRSVITVRIRFINEEENEEEFYEENESTNLYDTLSQPGHSGIIEGLCRVHYPKEYAFPEKFFEADASPNEVKVTFSFGTKPLGTYTFVAVSFNGPVGGHLVLENTEDEILVDIEYDNVHMMDFCRFRAVLYEKS